QNAEGARLFEEGRALAKDGKYVEACATFEKSLQLDPAPGTKLNYGDCHEHLGHLAQVYRLFLEVAEADKTANPDRAKFAKSRADALVAKLGTLVINIPDPAAVSSVAIAGRIVPTAGEISEKVDPGDVIVEVKLRSGSPFKQTAAAKAGAAVTIDVPTPAGGGSVIGGGGGGGGGEPSDASQRRHTRLIYAYAAGGVGLASMITGGALGLVARSNYHAQLEGENPNCSNTSPPQCNPEGFSAQQSAITLANVGTGFFVGGIALVGVGAVLFLTAPKADGDLVVTPTASSESAGLAVVGTF
ncbi:MAG TPA: tetratricopeptide repeat protein, partial [Kofleriaceae bacterium]|nr:tetratricopeptide repeat protein [Kofleriaceae bacterium]